MTRTVSALFVALSLTVFAPVIAVAQTKTSAKPAPIIEAAAMAVLRKSADKMLALKTFQATCSTTYLFTPTADGKRRPNQYRLATLTAVKPNIMRCDEWAMTPAVNPIDRTKWKRKLAMPEITLVSDGKTFWRQFGSFYRKDSHTEPEYMSTPAQPWGGFYKPEHSPFDNIGYYKSQGNLLGLRLEGSQSVNGTPCDIVHSRTKTQHNGKTIINDARFYVAKDGIIHRKLEAIQFDGKTGYTTDAIVQDIVLNAPVATRSKLFTYTPPKGVRLQVVTPGKPRVDPALLTAGTVAPDFTAIGADGKPVKLSDFKGKVVVVDFWASWCPPCVASMPHNQKVIAKLQAEGLPVVMLAVDNGEGREPFDKWVKAHPEYAALQFVHADPETNDISGKLYKVSGIPTQYIVGADGTIRWSTVGFSGESDDLEKAIRAALPPK